MSAATSGPEVKPTPSYEELHVDEHFYDRWAERSPRSQLNPSIAWLESIPVDYPSATPPADRTRYHEVTQLLLLATPEGRLVTCIRLEDRPDDEQRYIRDQIEVTDR
ncbi:hypothetical protein [Natrarchaeobaculum sulfurireducens]|uniref:RelE toxin-related domain-containing protein n=1 Tax=Natrarchaeobaculum sulfurireducens TaxID=2044521 RepID=A0A346PHH0_9EURY|nr:hypothetical protein [Natrarchaeobaculum sulfurireducens]AXR78965.1 hypothetical protein AArc1_2652 [Natrarchaeobaculum sulfurireducens]AXR80989.1 hypothetical protein AArcMg_0971 [Natrarchaeobaculum sulfurireducens]